MIYVGCDLSHGEIYTNVRHENVPIIFLILFISVHYVLIKPFIYSGVFYRSVLLLA